MSYLPFEQVLLSDQTELHHQHFLQSSQSHSLGLQLQHHVYPKDQKNNKQTGRLPKWLFYKLWLCLPFFCQSLIMGVQGLKIYNQELNEVW